MDWGKCKFKILYKDRLPGVPGKLGGKLATVQTAIQKNLKQEGRDKSEIMHKRKNQQDL